MRENRPVRLLGRLLVLLALLCARAPSAACPSCATGAETKSKSVWPLVGAFLLVPPALGAAVVALIRRESRR